MVINAIKGKCDSCSKGKWHRFDLKEFAAKRFAPDELKAQRLEICKTCINNKVGKVCSKCGCILEWKTALLNTKCPIGNW